MINKEQKQAIGLLSIGTFLEYFDLMLYVHMAVLLNELFFPKSDPHIAAIITASTFCTTYLFRPFGAILFGWIGDNIGRKSTIIMTTVMMAICCSVMAICPTYAQIGITATYIMMGCRILQGLCSMGEVVGALLYLTEFIQKPARYYAVAIIPSFAALGGVVSLGLATLATSYGANWRMAFVIGAIIAGVGIFARTALRETPEFANAIERLKQIEQKNKLVVNAQQKEMIDKPINNKSSLSLFLMECMWPLCFYFVFIFCSDILKNKFHYTSEEIIYHNFLISLTTIFGCIYRIWACSKVHPLKMLKNQLIISSVIFLFSPFCLNNIVSPITITILQVLILFFAADSKFISSVLYPHFPVFKRFKATALLYALSRALTYVATSFGMIYLSEWMGSYGILIGMLIVTLATAYGLHHFWQLEKKSGDLERYNIIQ